MTILYGRKYQLYIGRREELIETTKPSIVVKPNGIESVPAPLRILDTDANVVDEAIALNERGSSYQDFLVIPNDHILIEHLRLKAKISDRKTGKTNKDVTSLQVLNLTEENQQFIRVDDTVLLKAGYVDNGELPLVFNGTVTSVTSVKQGQDTVTYIKCKSGGVVRKNVKISKNPRRDETVQDMVEYLAGIAAKNGIPTGEITVPSSFATRSGSPLVGNFFTVMETYCDDYNMRAYISLGKLYIEPKGYTEFKEVVNVTEADVKGSIRPVSSSVGKAATGVKKGVKFTVFLDGRITTSKKVRVKYGVYSGDYKIVQTDLIMDSEGKEWDSVVTCERIA